MAEVTVEQLAERVAQAESHVEALRGEVEALEGRLTPLAEALAREGVRAESQDEQPASSKRGSKSE